MQVIVLQICIFKYFQPQAYQPTQPVMCPLQTQSGFLQLLPCSFQEGRNLQERLLSLFMVWNKTEDQSISPSLSPPLSFSFPLSPPPPFPFPPPEKQHRMWDHKYINVFHVTLGEVEGSGNLLKSVSQASEMTSLLIWGGSPRICWFFCLIFNKLPQLILMTVFWKSDLDPALKWKAIEWKASVGNANLKW